MNSPKVTLKQFLLDLLDQEDKSNIIEWTNSGEIGEFKFKDASAVSKLWGEKKGNPDMDYDKLSRALRYYYDTGDMKKVVGKPFVYQFLNVGKECKVKKENAPPVFKSSFSVQSLMSTPSPRSNSNSVETPSPSYSNFSSSSTPSTSSPANSDDSTNSEKPSRKRKAVETPITRGEPQARRSKLSPLNSMNMMPMMTYNPMMFMNANYYMAALQCYSQMMQMGNQQMLKPATTPNVSIINQYTILNNSLAQLASIPKPGPAPALPKSLE